MKDPKVLIIIINYNNWWDTIECLESVLRNNYANYQIVMIENNSSNNSMNHIKAWAKGKLNVWLNPNNPLRKLSYPPVYKSIPYVYYTRDGAENGGNPAKEKYLEESVKSNNTITTQYPLVFVQSGSNLGFAGGNNIGIRYALQNQTDYVWLLNNDTVIDSDCLVKLIKKIEECKAEKVGLIGSKLVYYNRPDVIQAVGGRYNKWLAKTKTVGICEKDDGQYDKENIKLDYVIGASMLVSKTFIEDVGLLEEDYFLYFEELDWAIRAQYKKWKICYCYQSKVYHKDGASIGSDSLGLKRDDFADYLSLRNRIIFTRKFYPILLPFVYFSFIGCLINRFRPSRLGQLKNVLRAIFTK